MKLLKDSDANAIIGAVAFISIEKANRLIMERLKEKSVPRKGKKNGNAGR